MDKDKSILEDISNITLGRKRGGVLGELSLMNYISEQKQDIKIIPNMISRSTIEQRSRQTDLLVLTPQSIYSIEVKNGIVFMRGNENDSEWFIRTRCSGLSMLKMNNPVIQNKKHIESLEDVFKSVFDQDIEIKNIVCVTNEKVKLLTDCKEVFTPSSFVEQLNKDSYLPVSYDIDLLYSFFNRVKELSN